MVGKLFRFFALAILIGILIAITVLITFAPWNENTIINTGVCPTYNYEGPKPIPCPTYER